MPGLIFLIMTVVVALIFINRKGYHTKGEISETFLSYLLFFNVGCMGLLAFYAHVFNADATAQSIGWAVGSPFQFEMGMTNLAIGVAGVLCYWYRGLFWMATITIVTVLFWGCFIGHLIEYSKGDTAPYNIGLFIWFSDLLVPLLAVVLYSMTQKK